LITVFHDASLQSHIPTYTVTFDNVLYDGNMRVVSELVILWWPLLS